MFLFVCNLMHVHRLMAFVQMHKFVKSEEALYAYVLCARTCRHIHDNLLRILSASLDMYINRNPHTYALSLCTHV